MNVDMRYNATILFDVYAITTITIYHTLIKNGSNAFS